MGIRIISGRQFRVLSEIVYKEIGEALTKGKENLFLIVPEQYSLGAEDALIKANGLKGLLGAEVLSPKRIGDRVLRETGGLTKIFMDAHGKNMLLQKTLGEIKDQLKIYGRSVKKLGFLQNMSDFITELKQNEISSKNLKNLIETLEPGMICSKLRDIAIIYDHFNQLLGENRLDQEDLQHLICEKIPRASFLKSSEIWFDGFQNFSRQDYKMIRALANTASEVNFSLTWEENSSDAEVFRLTQKTFDSIKQIGAEEMLSFHLEKIPFKENKTASLNHLEKTLFAFPKKIYTEEVKDIECIECKNSWEEVEKAAQKILKLVRDEGFLFGDLVVLSGDSEEYGSIIKSVFTQYEIPFFMDDLRAVGDNYLIEAVMASLEAISSYYRFDDIFGFIKTGFSPISLKECEDLENYALEFSIRGSQWEREFTKISSNEALDLTVLNALRLKVITPLTELRKKMKGKKTCADRTQSLYEFLVAIGSLQKIEAWVEKFFDDKNYEAMGNYHQIWNILMEVFDQIAKTMGEDLVNQDDYLEILKSGFQGYQLGVIPPYRDVVNITDLRRSRSGDFKVLLVLGLNEGLIPGTGSEPKLISDNERQILAGHAVFFQNNREFQMDQESFLVYELFTKPQEGIVLCWSLMDMEGNARRPSILIAQIREIFPNLNIQSTRDKEDPLDCINTPKSTFGYLTQFLREEKEGEKDQQDHELKEVWDLVQLWFSSHKDYQKTYEHLIKILNYEGIEDTMLPQEAVKLYGKTMGTSISRLEKYQHCPFSHYLEYGLKPKGRPLYEIKALEIGTLLHQVIEGFFDHVKENTLDVRTISKETRDHLVEEILTKRLPQIKTNVFNSTAHYQYLGKKLERVSKKSLDILIQQLCAGEFIPQYHEFNFEKEIPLPQGFKNKELKELKIRGKIDRIDLYEKEGNTWVKVIDYKSGLKKLNYSDIYYGLSLQLLIYLEGALSEIEGERIFPGGSFYFHLDDPMPQLKLTESVEDAINKAFKLNGLLLDNPDVINAMDRLREKDQSSILPLHHASESKLSPKEFDEIMAYVRDTVIQQVSKIYEGDIKIKPYRKGEDYACKYCEYGAICQFDQDIRKTGYDSLETSMKKDEFFKLIKNKICKF